MRWTVHVLAVVVFTSTADADTPRHRPGRITCTAVRNFVAMVGKEQAERMARATGASDARIETARRCLRG